MSEVRHNPAESALIDGFEAGLGALPGEAWAPDRRAAMARFGALGLPHRRIESWKYSDLRAALRKGLPAATGETRPGKGETPPLFGDIGRHEIVIRNGQFRADLSRLDGLEKGVEISSLADALGAAPGWLRETLGTVNPQSGEAVLALNFALMSAGVVVRVPAGVTVAKPLHIAFENVAGAPPALAMHSVIALEKGAGLSVFETHEGTGGGLVNVALEIALGEDALLDHVVVQRAGPGAYQISSAMVELGAKANYRGFAAAFGARFARRQTFARFAGAGARFALAGATMIAGRQHNDTTVIVDHAVPGCHSDVLFKSVVDERAHGVFQGKVSVAPQAQKSDGRQMTKGLLLSGRAAFTAKPELEIFADDVQCAHGATSGQLDADLLFYLRSRGIPEAQAKSMLITAFVGEAIEKTAHEGARARLLDLAGNWLSAHSHGDDNG